MTNSRRSQSEKQRASRGRETTRKALGTSFWRSKVDPLSQLLRQGPQRAAALAQPAERPRRAPGGRAAEQRGRVGAVEGGPRLCTVGTWVGATVGRGAGGSLVRELLSSAPRDARRTPRRTAPAHVERHFIGSTTLIYEMRLTHSRASCIQSVDPLRASAQSRPALPPPGRARVAARCAHDGQRSLDEGG